MNNHFFILFNSIVLIYFIIKKIVNYEINLNYSIEFILELIEGSVRRMKNHQHGVYLLQKFIMTFNKFIEKRLIFQIVHCNKLNL